LGSDEPAAEGTPAAESLERLHEVRTATAEIEAPVLRVQALLDELRDPQRDRDQILAELNEAMAEVQAVDAELARSLDEAEAVLLTSP